MTLTKTEQTELQNRVDKILGKDRVLVEDSDEDRLCWRCGELESEHSYFQGKTYCLPEADEDSAVAIYDREIQFYPPELSDEELVCRFSFLRDVCDWGAL